MTLWKHTSIPVPNASDIQSRQAVLFLDRDGVLLVDKHYLRDAADVELVPGSARALREAHDQGLLLIGISNQSGIGRGLFGESELEAVMIRMVELLAAEAVALDAFFYCPHDPAAHCQCRKPAAGLLAEAAQLVTWDAGRSYFVGDKLSDVQLGLSAGLTTFLVRTGEGREQETRLSELNTEDGAVQVVDDLAAAVACIQAREGM